MDTQEPKVRVEDPSRAGYQPHGAAARPSLAQRLHSILSEANYIQKDKNNSAQGYRYASEAAIKTMFHELFSRHGVIMLVDTSNLRTMDTASKDPAVPSKISLLDVEYRFISSDDRSDCISGKFVGTGNGRDDKGNYAAVTGAIKYILTSTFLTPTGDDPEDDRNEAGREKPTPAAAKKPAEAAERVADSDVDRVLQLAQAIESAATAEELKPVRDALRTNEMGLPVRALGSLVDQYTAKAKAIKEKGTHGKAK